MELLWVQKHRLLASSNANTTNKFPYSRTQPTLTPPDKYLSGACKVYLTSPLPGIDATNTSLASGYKCIFNCTEPPGPSILISVTLSLMASPGMRSTFYLVYVMVCTTFIVCYVKPPNGSIPAFVFCLGHRRILVTPSRSHTLFLSASVVASHSDTCITYYEPTTRAAGAIISLA